MADADFDALCADIKANGSVTAITIEIEWSRKSGPKRRKQARSILDQVRSTDTFVFIAYPYPPALMGEFLRARQPAGPCPRTLNHERDWRAALNAQGAEPEDLLRIYFVRLEVTSRLELQQVQWFKADKINLDVKQPGGNLYEAIGTVNQVWQCLGQWDPTNTFEGSTWLHLATGFTLKICAAFPVDAISPGYELCAHLRPWNRREVEDQDVDDMACEIYEEWRANGAARRECFPHTPSLLRDFETDARFATLWFEKQIPALQALQRKWISEAIDMAWKQDEARFN